MQNSSNLIYRLQQQRQNGQIGFPIVTPCSSQYTSRAARYRQSFLSIMTLQTSCINTSIKIVVILRRVSCGNRVRQNSSPRRLHRGSTKQYNSLCCISCNSLLMFRNKQMRASHGVSRKSNDKYFFIFFC